MESKNYELYMIAIPLNGSQLQEDFYNFINKYCKMTPPILATSIELGEKETTIDLWRIMRHMMEEGSKYGKFQAE